MNDSSTGGYLLPSLSPAPLEGQALFRFMQQFFVGITGLDGQLFFPRWQPEPPNLPPVGTPCWAAFGINARGTSVFAFTKHVPAVTGPPDVPAYDEYRRHEELDILTSFYGPESDTYATLLRDGIQIPQNLEVIEQAGMGLIETGELKTVPELTKERWLQRVDLTVRIRRQIVRRYAIQSLVGADVTVNNELYTTAITVSN